MFANEDLLCNPNQPATIYYYIVVVVHTLSISLCPDATLRFASSYGDHMVLQKSPARAVLWGFAPEGTQINVSLSGTPRQDATAVVDGEGGVRPLCSVEGPHKPESERTTYNCLCALHNQEDQSTTTLLHILLF